MKKTLVHIHLYYIEQTDILLDKLKSMGDHPYDLFITMVEPNATVEQKIKSLHPDVKIIITKNVGADLWPFIHILQIVDLNEYDYIIKLHTKRNMPSFNLKGYFVGGVLWRNYLLNFLLTPDTFRKCLSAFENNAKLGMIADHRLIMHNSKKTYDAMLQTKELLKQSGLSETVEFVAGTMFMARAELFHIVKDLQLTENDFRIWSSVNQCPSAAVMEAFIGSVIVAQGYDIADVFTPIGQKRRHMIKKMMWQIVNFFYRKQVEPYGYIIKILKISIYKKKLNPPTILPYPLPYQYIPIEEIVIKKDRNQNHKVFFVSFADSRMRKSGERLTQQAIDMNVFDEIYIMDERNLSLEFMQKMKDKLVFGSRGFGYWSWKPQIVKQVMEKMSDGDILLFSDIGCHLNAERSIEMLALIEKTKKSQSGILGFQTSKLIEKQWTKGDLFDYFNVRNRSDITETGQLSGTFFFIRKSVDTENFVEQWLYIFENHFELADDTPSKSPNCSGFRENRHDQSIFSILGKINQIELVVDQHKVKHSERHWKKYSFPIQIRRDKK